MRCVRFAILSKAGQRPRAGPSTSVEGLGNREISAHHLSLWRQASRVLVTYERTDLGPL